MSKYIVSTMIQAPANEPVHVHWYRGDDLARAISAMASAAVHDSEVDDSNMPESVRYRTLGVTLSIEPSSEQETERMIAEVRAMADLPGSTEDVRGCSCGMADYGAPGHEGHSATDSTVSFDSETKPLALSDCVYWPRVDTDCAGPRVGTIRSNDGRNGVVMCEYHFNSRL